MSINRIRYLINPYRKQLLFIFGNFNKSLLVQIVREITNEFLNIFQNMENLHNQCKETKRILGKC